MSFRNIPKTGAGAKPAQVQRKLVIDGTKPRATKTVKAAKAAAAAVTLASRRKSLPVRVPGPNAVPSFLGKARRALTGGIFGTKHA